MSSASNEERVVRRAQLRRAVMTQDAAVRGLLRKAQDDLRRVEENWVDGVTMIGGRDAKTSLLATPSSLEGVKEQLDLAIHIIRVDQVQTLAEIEAAPEAK